MSKTPDEQIEELQRLREDLFTTIKSLREAIALIEEGIGDLIAGRLI